MALHNHVKVGCALISSYCTVTAAWPASLPTPVLTEKGLGMRGRREVNLDVWGKAVLGEESRAQWTNSNNKHTQHTYAGRHAHTHIHNSQSIHTFST